MENSEKRRNGFYLPKEVGDRLAELMESKDMSAASLAWMVSGRFAWGYKTVQSFIKRTLDGKLRLAIGYRGQIAADRLAELFKVLGVKENDSIIDLAREGCAPYNFRYGRTGSKNGNGERYTLDLVESALVDGKVVHRKLKFCVDDLSGDNKPMFADYLVYRRR